ncbi:uncharacterized protein LOC127143215 [Lates calcarifer]|uniref:Uncharacterized protein LOC127143215 n=1 Tax=Lates calcarifer TaxID=8187 RepID=A0AAJ8BDZ0_LATCA|nr:uncharacterized protein LOC127143215 [Lates calcarifer]
MISFAFFFCNIRKLQHSSQKSKEMRLIDMKPEPEKESSPQYSDNPKSSDTHESDSDKDDNAGEVEHKTQTQTKLKPMVVITDRTVQTPAGREMDPGQSHVSSKITEGASCSEPQDSEKDQMCKLRSSFIHSGSYPELNTHLWDPSVPNNLFHSAQVNTWDSCSTMDRIMPCGPCLGVPVRTPGTPGFPISFQQHALVQDLIGLSQFGGFLFYPYASLSARSKVDFRAYPIIHSQDYFTYPIISSSVPPAGGGGLKYLIPDLLMLPKTEQMNSVGETEIKCSEEELQTGRQF